MNGTRECSAMSLQYLMWHSHVFIILINYVVRICGSGDGGGVCFGIRYNMMISAVTPLVSRSNQFIIAYSENPF